MINLIANIIVICMMAFGIIMPLYLLRKHRKYREQRRIEHEAFLKYLEEQLAEMLKSSFNSESYPKWAKLEKKTREKILKVATLVERGIDGERLAAQDRLDVMMNKYELTINDIPK